jgi:hypothetical protein
MEITKSREETVQLSAKRRKDLGCMVEVSVFAAIN